MATETLEYHPSEFLDRAYSLPLSVTQGKTQITVRFEAREEAIAGSLFDLRLVRDLQNAQ